ncbi:hypothetical protein WJ970_02455 [Achromobacter xylosoxidans]
MTVAVTGSKKAWVMAGMADALTGRAGGPDGNEAPGRRFNLYFSIILFDSLLVNIMIKLCATD